LTTGFLTVTPEDVLPGISQQNDKFMKSLQSALIISIVSILGFVSAGNPPRYFLTTSGDRPYGIAFGDNGFMYVVTAPSTGNGHLLKISPDGHFRELALLEGTFIGPGVTVDAAENVFVTVGDKLLKVSPDGRKTTVADGFSKCFDVKIDTKGTLFVADEGRGVIYRINTSGEREVFYRSDTAGSFLLTGMCLDTRRESLFVRDGNKLIRFHLLSDQNPGTPEIVSQHSDIFYFCKDDEGNTYASTIKSVIRIDAHENIQTLAQEGVDTATGLALGGEGFDKNSLYVAVAGGILQLPLSEQ
jgi:sugar lactone lactonase YvrE